MIGKVFTWRSMCPGDQIAGGMIYVGNTYGPEIYTTTPDRQIAVSFNEAAAYARRLNAEHYLGYSDWRVPTKPELAMLFEHRSAIGGFDETAHYWSAEDDGADSVAWSQSFRDGTQELYLSRKSDTLSLRCVRG